MNKNHSFVRLAAANIDTRVANVKHNTEEIKKTLIEADKKSVNIVVFSELTLSSYTADDLFNQSSLINACKNALIELANFSKNIDTHFIVGAPFILDSAMYNTAFFIGKGEIIGAVPKINIPNYNEFYEKRWFTSGRDIDVLARIKSDEKDFVFPFTSKQIFTHSDFEHFDFGIEICEDLWVMEPPSTKLAKNGAKVIFNLSASNEVTGKNAYRKNLISIQSAKTFTSYVYSSASFSESTSRLIFSGKLIIADNGRIAKENKRFEKTGDMIIADIDLEAISNERTRRTSIYKTDYDYRRTEFNCKIKDIDAEITLSPLPFIPSPEQMDERCSEILNMQALGLVKRLRHIGIERAVIGISGGLDSTLALLATYHAFRIMGLDSKNITAVTMPGFGTSDRTYENAVKLIKELGLNFKEISIKEASIQHFKDIGHDINNKNVVYENAQARERTQILMDIANMEGGLVIGTGDLSELALGFATYNGDQMSMYGLNASIPKTLVKELVKWASKQEEYAKVGDILYDVYATPVSPELLPPDGKGKIAQVTEDIIGPYELHDFFLYHLLKHGFSAEKILFLATKVFAAKYDEDTIRKWLKIFIKRFWASQFKRSAMPDGVKIGTICLSPKGDLRMPSDAEASAWLDEI